MKRLLLIAVVLTLCACKVEKTSKDTYKVIAPTPEAKAAGEKAKVEATQAAEKLKEGAAVAAQRAGAGLEKAGQKVQEHTGSATSTSTTESVSSTATADTTTTVTETHGRSTKRH